jgi:hypothetical protein
MAPLIKIYEKPLGQKYCVSKGKTLRTFNPLDLVTAKDVELYILSHVRVLIGS